MNSLNIMLYSEILAFCFILILCIAGKVYRSEKPESGSRLLRFILCTAFTVLVNFLWVNANGNTIASTSTVKLVTALYYISLNTSFFFWMRYSEGELFPGSASVKSYLLISSLPYIIINILIVASCFFDWIFTVDELNNFKPGPIWVGEYVFIFATLLWSAGTAFSFTNKTTDPAAKRKGSLLASFVILPFVCLLLHVFAKGSPLGVIALSLLAVFSYRELDRAEVQAARDEAARKERDYLARLEEADAQFRTAEQLRLTFLRRLSLDFSGPLATIAALTEKARDNADNPSVVADYLNKIDFTGSYLSRLLTDVTELSDLESGNLKLSEELTDLGAEMETLAEDFRTDAAGDSIAVTADFSGLRDKIVRHDARRLNQLLETLLANARKNAGEAGEIFFGVKQTESEAPDICSYIFTINDNGPALSEEQAARLFAVSTDAADEGTGFSLALVKKLTELMGGRVEVESVPQQGTTVSVYLSFAAPTEAELEALQAAEAEAAENAAAADSEEAASPEEETAETDTEADAYPADADTGAGPDAEDEPYLPQPEDIAVLSTLKLLLADDEPPFRTEEREFLEALGVEVTEATDGADTIEKVRNSEPGQYDALLIDADMPHINGYEAAQTIRTFSDSSLAGLPIIIMDRDDSPQARQEAKSLGADELVGKPLGQRTVVALLRYCKKEQSETSA